MVHSRPHTWLSREESSCCEPFLHFLLLKLPQIGTSAEAVLESFSLLSSGIVSLTILFSPKDTGCSEQIWAAGSQGRVKLHEKYLDFHVLSQPSRRSRIPPPTPFCPPLSSPPLPSPPLSSPLGIMCEAPGDPGGNCSPFAGIFGGLYQEY